MTFLNVELIWILMAQSSGCDTRHIATREITLEASQAEVTGVRRRYVTEGVLGTLQKHACTAMDEMARTWMDLEGTANIG